MKNFEIVSPKWEELLALTDTVRLAAFLQKFRAFVSDSDDYPEDEDWRQFFRTELSSGESREWNERISASIESFLRWYQEVMGTDYDGLRTMLTEIQESVGVPEEEYDFPHAFLGICLRILSRHTAIVEHLLSDDLTEQTKDLVARVMLAREEHPLGLVLWDEHEFRWISGGGYFHTKQDINGDIHVGQRSFVEKWFTDDSAIIRISWEEREIMSIYQWPDGYVGALCHYALLIWKLPRELLEWRRIRSESLAIIPNAGNALDDPNYGSKSIVAQYSWRRTHDWFDQTGEYRYMGNSFGKEGDIIACMDRQNRLVFLKNARDGASGGVLFDCFRGDMSFNPVLVFNPEDIGPALRAIYHFPWRSVNKITKALSAFDQFRAGELDVSDV